MDPTITKRTPDKSLVNLTPFRGTAHSMHRKDGEQGTVTKEGKVEYADVGRKSGEEPFGYDKNAKHYPSLSIPAGKMPALKDEKLGDEITLSVKARITGAHHSQGSGSRFELQVEKVALLK